MVPCCHCLSKKLLKKEGLALSQHQNEIQTAAAAFNDILRSILGLAVDDVDQ